ncbi:aldehyde dehydrogenase family protein [Alkalimarinus alittae]|uniref:Aldehyde dehydrogenase family protein n=1 Tax=Alkalimarinus alittae TaxID=2961619 RepID=A0ABY6N3D8_9ALTE|nr:aldehyde dehydrogenase family protein [Alkalimarinus alittae]UZE96621.1 aldehyde dehydrogenase family protein [Alkalimarinus alittae]
MNITLHSPIDGREVAERTLASAEQISAAVDQATSAQQRWKRVALSERAEICHKAIDYFIQNQESIAHEITLQMGRPIQYAAGEVKGVEERGRYMIDVAEFALADQLVEENNSFNRFIRHEPLGVVVTIAPWNYPYLTAVNSIIPAIMAGNTVVLKHSNQTFLCAERFAEAFQYAGLPEGVFQYLHLDHESTSALINHEGVDFVSFTGSVSGGKKIEKSLAGSFKGLALELGGKDPAYIREDANLAHAIEGVLDGAFFNSGQSCCGIERVYVHASLYERFVTGAINQVYEHTLGNPLVQETTLGPMVSAAAAEAVQQQIEDAIAQGAIAGIDQHYFERPEDGAAYMPPQILTHVNHQMRVMTEESFGPVIGVMSVANDEEAIRLMNDSQYGLTASIWTEDEEQALVIGDQLETGTVFMNRCDYLDPALPWSGVKQSGRGCALSALGYQQLTRPKSFHLRRI